LKDVNKKINLKKRPKLTWVKLPNPTLKSKDWDHLLECK
jgi:hypothetical protein